jgi:uracil-DNA glycosylase
MTEISENKALKAICDWWSEMGVEADGALIRAFAAAEARPAARPPARRRLASQSLDARVSEARRLAQAARDMAQLVSAIESFDGCPLKEGARNTVVHDGVAGSDVMVIGEGPGAQEDATGKPFVGRAGQLLDRMLAAIDLSRQTNALITNVIYWRPPGNRNPDAGELAVCRPFVERMVEINAPRLIIAAGNVPTRALINTPGGIMKLRGTRQEFITPSGVRVPVFPIFHPAYLLRQPKEKSRAWRDLLRIEQYLGGPGDAR